MFALFSPIHPSTFFIQDNVTSAREQESEREKGLDVIKFTYSQQDTHKGSEKESSFNKI
jgi:hypothetical protein